MHELTFVEHIFDTVTSYAQAHNARRVVNITLRIGQMSHLNHETIALYWKTVAEKSVAHDAAISCIRIPATIRCVRCGRTMRYIQYIRTCPSCGSIKLAIDSGEELEIESIVIES